MKETHIKGLTSNDLVNKLLLTEPDFNTRCEIYEHSLSCTFLDILYHEFAKCAITQDECWKVCDMIVKRGFDLTQLSTKDCLMLKTFDYTEVG